jgi:hypothetical protein
MMLSREVALTSEDMGVDTVLVECGPKTLLSADSNF